MQPKILGGFLKGTRTKGGHGTIPTFAAELGVNKNTLGSYEREESLPDIDFLAIFSNKTGCSFINLVKLRLLASDATASNDMAKLLDEGPTIEGVSSIVVGLQESGMHVQQKLLSSILFTIDDIDINLNPEKKAATAAKAYALLYAAADDKKSVTKAPLEDIKSVVNVILSMNK